MVELLNNGTWHISYKEFIIEIDPKDFFTSIYIKEYHRRTDADGLELRLLKTDQSASHIIDCLFKGFRIIYEYNKGDSTSMQY